MKTNFLTAIALWAVYAVSAQPNQSHREEMINSGEGAPKTDLTQVYRGDYDSYVRTNAWNARTEATSAFHSVNELDLSIIGGRVRGILVDKDNDIALVAPSGGGLWNFDATTGTPFSPIDDLGSFMAITEITQNPFSKQEILIGSGDRQHGVPGNGLFRSTDGGQSFTPLASTDPDLNSDYTYIRFVKYSPETAGVIYFSARGHLFKSTDSGASFTEVLDLGFDDIRSLDFLPNGGVIVAVDDRGIYSSPSGNNGTFSIQTNGIPNDENKSSGILDGLVVATHAANRNIAYALTTGAADAVYKTTNGGQSWTQVTTPSFTISQSWFCLTIGVHPTNPNNVVGGSVGWGYTEDGGNSWTKGADLEVDFHAVHFHESNPDIAYIGYDQGLGRVDFSQTADQWSWNGSQWVQIPQIVQDEIGKTAGFNTTQIYYGDYFPQTYGDAIIYGQQDGGCFAQVGAVTRRIRVGDGGSVFVNKQDPTKAYACTQSGRISKSSAADVPDYDSYASYGNIYQNHPNWITQFAGNDADGDQMYISSNTGIERTLNFGGSFSNVASHSLSGVKVACENNTNPNVYALGYKGSSNWNSDLIKISNAATSSSASTFTDAMTYSADGTPDHINVDPNDANAILVTGSRGTAYRISGLGGSSFVKEDITGDISDVTFNTMIGIAGHQDWLIAGTNIGVFVSEDDGASWTQADEFPHTQVTDLRYRASDERLFVFTYGRGAWAATVDFLATSNMSNEEESMVHVFPNPSTEWIYVEGLERQADLKLYDQKGIEVQSSTGSEPLNVAGLSTGLYILHVSGQEGLLHTEAVQIMR